MQDNNEYRYSDIINLPHHVSASRKQMSAHDRAAQFSPFAALTGYDSEIEETARLTDVRWEADEYTAQKIDTAIELLIENAADNPLCQIEYFVADKRKEGGAYITYTGNFRRADESNNTLVFTDGKRISIADIYDIKSELADDIADFEND